MKELDIIIEVNRLKHLCEVHEKEQQEQKKAEIWKAIMSTVSYLSEVISHF